MRVQVRKWGNSLALRIPKPFAEDTEVGEGTIVDLSVSEGKLVVVPVQKKNRKRKKIALEQLLAGVSKANLHGELDSGPSVGRESW